MANRKVALVAGFNGTAVIRWDSEWQEYTVTLNNSEASRYHTDNCADALATAHSIAKGSDVEYLGTAGAAFQRKVVAEVAKLFGRQTPIIPNSYQPHSAE